ncbi:MAG: homoserine dehydrogenase [Rhizobiales bacterium]|nr:homoserine dehydrogenase [Hyphomicrobiales bacterium]NRB14999.1 homoserine dehydrogenase [Hyphomicrobiales bacterium]
MSDLRLGVAGLGTVGVGVLKLVNSRQTAYNHMFGMTMSITAVSARTKNAERGVSLDGYTWFDDARELAKSAEIDVFVELIGGDEGIAKQAVINALEAGKHVVTANKALIAKHGIMLAKLAEANKVALMFEAAVAGGIPIIRVMSQSVVANEITHIAGIMNGTCNYILTTMEKDGTDFGDVLADAQAKGYAEADPTFDVGGIDTAHKLAILTSLAFGTEVDFESIYIEGIEQITAADIRNAGEMGYCIKLLGMALKTDSGIEQRVHPALVSKKSPIAAVDDVNNAVYIESKALDGIMLEGKGAGEGPTASSVVSDILQILRGFIEPAFILPTANLKPYEKARMNRHEGGYYVALSVKDKVGALAAISERMAEASISIDSLIQQKDQSDAGVIPVTLITAETSEREIRQVLKKMASDGYLTAESRVIRIENFS